MTNKYINGKQKLDYICPNGHKHRITFYNWNAGYRCPKCVVDRQKISIDLIRHELNKEGYTLLTINYKNNKQRLKCICSNNHHCTITWAGWNGRGDRCGICGYNSMALKQYGTNNHNWKGGITCEPYCQDWTKEYKEFIKERDGYRCLNPDCWGKDKLLSIHHIDYNKKNCKPSNLITVCRSCNARANFDRNWHQFWYQAIINKRYNGNYNVTFN